MTITVSTDGSALGNPNGPMGWAWADHATPACDAGGATNGTNQIGELCAVLEALRAHTGSEPLVIETDSQYAINCSTKWVHGWKKNGWKNAQKKPVKNAALIKAIDAEISARAGSVKFVWVKGHAGNAGNEKVDELARTYAGDCRSGVRDGYLPKEGWESLLASEYAKGTDVPEDARMLMDGRISAEEYHLGRGEGTGEATTATAGATATLGGQSQAEPEGVPDYPDFSAAKNTGKSDTGRVSLSDAFHTDRPAPENDAAVSAVESGTMSETVSSDATAAAPNAPASLNVTVATPVQPLQPPSPSTPSGLAVSGTLRFTPPPSSSPTYDGQPRMISGYVLVDGYVNGDGTLTIDSAPFIIRQH